jgi:F0F1-type ATP synthase delta subunit
VEHNEHGADQFHLPNVVVGAADLMRLRRELDALYDYLHQAVLRHVPADQIKMPKTSRTLDEVVKLNKIDLLDRGQYDQLISVLDEIEHKAPRVHVAFSADPSAAFAGQIVDWFRANIHPAVLVQIGLQPTIGAGCVLRTPNKQFDFSIKEHLKKMRPQLIAGLEKELAA